MKSIKPILIFLTAILIVIPAAFYFFSFGANGISNKGGDWANFATFISLFVGICNLIFFALLTYYIHDYNESNNIFLNNRNRMLERPIISFSLMQGRYFIQNIGNGPAINIVVKTDLHNGKWDYGFLWNSLQSCSNPESMNWTTKSNIICALYLDSFGHNYISYMENNNLITIDCLDESSVKKYSKEIEKSKLDAPTLTWKK